MELIHQHSYHYYYNYCGTPPPPPQYSKRPGKACHELQQLGSKLMEEELYAINPHGALMGDSMDSGRATSCAHRLSSALFISRKNSQGFIHTKHIKKQTMLIHLISESERALCFRTSQYYQLRNGKNTVRSTWNQLHKCLIQFMFSSGSPPDLDYIQSPKLEFCQVPHMSVHWPKKLQ